MFESERSDALERIVKNGHGTFTFTHRKRKNYCRKILLLIVLHLFLSTSQPTKFPSPSTNHPNSVKSTTISVLVHPSTSRHLPINSLSVPVQVSFLSTPVFVLVHLPDRESPAYVLLDTISLASHNHSQACYDRSFNFMTLLFYGSFYDSNNFLPISTEIFTIQLHATTNPKNYSIYK
jgi:hypothetical protein